MPAKSQAQRELLNAKFGHDWVRRHHFANKGKLPMHKHKKHKMSDTSRLVRLSKIDNALDSIIQFDDDDDRDKKSLLGSAATGTALVGAGVGGTLAHQAIQRTGGYGALLGRIQGGAGQAAGQVGQAAGQAGQAISTTARDATHVATQAGQAVAKTGQAAVNTASQAGKLIGSSARLGYGLERSGLGAGVKAGSGLAYKAGSLAGKGVNIAGSAWKNILAKLGGVAAKALESKDKPIIFESAEEPIEFGVLSDLSDKLVQKGYLRPKPWAKSLTGNRTWGGSPGTKMISTSLKSGLTSSMGMRPAFSGEFSSKDKPIEFDASILGPWQGSKGHISKIDQCEFPAGLSPAAALKFPLPMLMRYMNQRNIQQQVFSKKMERLVELNSRLDEIQFVSAKKAVAIGAASGLGAAGAAYGGYQAIGAIKEHNRKARRWMSEAGDEDFRPIARGLFVDKHGAMYPEKHPRVQSGNVTTLRSKLDEIQFREDRSNKTWKGAAVAGGVGLGGLGIYKTYPIARFAAGKAAGRVAAEREVSKIAKGVGPIGWGETGQLYKRTGSAFLKGALHARLSAKLDNLIEFAGGYVHTKEGVQKERGAGPHFNRAAGRYISLPFAAPTLGLSLGAGYLIDRARAKSNKRLTKYEPQVPAALGKGKPS